MKDCLTGSGQVDVITALADLVDESLPSPPKSGIHVVGQGEASGFPSTDRTSSHLEPGSELFVGDPHHRANGPECRRAHRLAHPGDDLHFGQLGADSFGVLGRSADRPHTGRPNMAQAQNFAFFDIITIQSFLINQNPHVDICTSIHLAIPFYLVILKNHVEELLFYKLREAKTLVFTRRSKITLIVLSFRPGPTPSRTSLYVLSPDNTSRSRGIAKRNAAVSRGLTGGLPFAILETQRAGIPNVASRRPLSQGPPLLGPPNVFRGDLRFYYLPEIFTCLFCFSMFIIGWNLTPLVNV